MAVGPTRTKQPKTHLQLIRGDLRVSVLPGGVEGFLDHFGVVHFLLCYEAFHQAEQGTSVTGIAVKIGAEGLFGVGVGYNFAKNLTGTLEYQKLNDSKVSAIAAGVKYSF